MTPLPPSSDDPAHDPLEALIRLAATTEIEVRNAYERPDSDVAHSGSDILARLARDYDRALRDPSYRPDTGVWQDARAEAGEPLPTLAQWQDKARAYGAHVVPCTILLRRPAIHELFEDLDSAQDAEILQPEKHVDVLHLFGGAALRRVPQGLPGLTRAEHHVVSLDSHIDMGAVRPAPPEVLP